MALFGLASLKAALAMSKPVWDFSSKRILWGLNSMFCQKQRSYERRMAFYLDH
jgi:hypothetical protein